MRLGPRPLSEWVSLRGRDGAGSGRVEELDNWNWQLLLQGRATDGASLRGTESGCEGESPFSLLQPCRLPLMPRLGKA